MRTVLETIDAGTQYLEKRGIDEARRNMQLLVGHQLGCTRTQLYVQFDRPLDEADLAPLRELLKQRGLGVPLQHLIGKVWFHQHEFFCSPQALIPRPETEELTEWILSWPLPESQAILDMGTGSGVLGLSLAAARPDWSLTLADVSPDALELAQKNLDSLGLANATLTHSHLFSQIPQSFDGIVANLPYVPLGDRATMTREVLHDPALALFSGEDGLDLLREFIPAAFQHLNPGGWIALEIGYNQAPTVAKLLEAAGFTEILTHSDLSGIPRFPYAKRPL